MGDNASSLSVAMIVSPKSGIPMAGCHSVIVTWDTFLEAPSFQEGEIVQVVPCNALWYTKSAVLVRQDLANKSANPC